MWNKILINMQYNLKPLKDKTDYRGNMYEFVEKLI
jgi:hypothetical protein